MSGPKFLKWKDVLKTLESFTSEQLEMPATILDLNNEDNDNCLIAGRNNFVDDTPALFFDSGYGLDFDRCKYYRVRDANELIKALLVEVQEVAKNRK